MEYYYYEKLKVYKIRVCEFFIGLVNFVCYLSEGACGVKKNFLRGLNSHLIIEEIQSSEDPNDSPVTVL